MTLLVCVFYFVSTLFLAPKSPCLPQIRNTGCNSGELYAFPDGTVSVEVFSGQNMTCVSLSLRAMDSL